MISPFQLRQKKLASLLARERIVAALIASAPNLRYLCGFTGSSGALIVHRTGMRFFTDGRYTAQAASEVKGALIEIVPSPQRAAIEWLKRQRIRKLGIEARLLSAAEWNELVRELKCAAPPLDAGALLLQMRIVKDAAELHAMHRAARLGSALFPAALRALIPGATEIQVAAQMEFFARSRGAEAMSFSTIVAGGVRSALPHGRASSARLPRRGFVVLDFGVILSGYCSDMTRTVHLGPPSERERNMYGAVQRAQAAAVAAVRPGRRFAEIDAAARRLLEREGWGRFFTHSCGHGVGLEIHEPPRLAAGQSGRLRAGMVITVEPGVYVPGEGGVRIEDMVLVTKSGGQVLTHGSRQLMVL